MQLRIYLTALAATLVFCGTVQAKPWLTMHRAEHAAVTSQLEPLPYLTDLAAFCTRESRTRVACDVQGFWGPGDPNGPVVTCDNCTDPTGQEVQLQVLVVLSHGRVRVVDNF